MVLSLFELLFFNSSRESFSYIRFMHNEKTCHKLPEPSVHKLRQCDVLIEFFTASATFGATWLFLIFVQLYQHNLQNSFTDITDKQPTTLYSMITYFYERPNECFDEQTKG